MSRARLRVKSGCDTCRRRRKKCDEQKPVCGHCERLGLRCTWGQAVEKPRSSATTSDQVSHEAAGKADRADAGMATPFGNVDGPR